MEAKNPQIWRPKTPFFGVRGGVKKGPKRGGVNLVLVPPPTPPILGGVKGGLKYPYFLYVFRYLPVWTPRMVKKARGGVPCQLGGGVFWVFGVYSERGQNRGFRVFRVFGVWRVWRGVFGSMDVKFPIGGRLRPRFSGVFSGGSSNG